MLQGVQHVRVLRELSTNSGENLATCYCIVQCLSSPRLFPPNHFVVNHLQLLRCGYMDTLIYQFRAKSSLAHTERMPLTWLDIPHTLSPIVNTHTTYTHTHLDASWTPGYELGKLPLSDTLQALVYLSGIYLSLDDVQDGDVAVVVPAVTWCRHHHIFWLKQERVKLHTSIGHWIGAYDCNPKENWWTRACMKR